MSNALAAADVMAVAMSRLLRDREVVLCGVSSALPLVAIQLARRLHAPRLVLLNVGGGVDARPVVVPASTAGGEMVRGTASIFDNTDFYDLVARGGLDTAFLGAGQIDPLGRVNTSTIGDFARPRVRLPGGGGAAMIMPCARRVILWRSDHSPRVFVPRCDFVTGAGNVDRVVTPLAVLRRGPEGTLQLESLHPGATLDQVLRATGFSLPHPDACPVTPPPTPEEAEALAAIDPNGVRFLEFR